VQVESAAFVKSSTELTQMPTDRRHEFACIGRSNVGKSSLINMLTRVKGLAKISATPGKTRLANHFLINEKFYLVDLPGYGYAKRSKAERETYHKLIWDYLLKRTELLSLLVLIDSRHEPMEADLEFLGQLATAGVPFAIAFTKVDKLSGVAMQKQIAHYKEVLAEQWEVLPPIFLTSAQTGKGREEVVAYMAACLASVPVKTF